MLVTTATSGVYSSSDPSLSSASATKHVPAAVVRVGARLAEIAADGEGRVKTAVLQRHDEHRGGGRLTVRSGHHQRGVAGHQLGEHRRPQDHRDAAPARLDQFGVGLRNRGVGGDHRRRARRAAGPATTRRARSGSPRRAPAARPPRAIPWRPSRTPGRRGRAGCGRCPTCPLPRCRPCAPAAVRRAATCASSTACACRPEPGRRRAPPRRPAARRHGGRPARPPAVIAVQPRRCR